MAGWRDIKATARATVHDTFEVPAVYLPRVGGTPVRLSVRDHTKVTLIEAKFDFADPGQAYAVQPKVICRSSEIAQVPVGTYIIFSATDVYVTGPSTPEREGYLEVECARLGATETAALVAAIDETAAVWQGIL